MGWDGAGWIATQNYLPSKNRSRNGVIGLLRLDVSARAHVTHRDRTRTRCCAVPDLAWPD